MKKSIQTITICFILIVILSINSFAYKKGPGVRVCSKKDCLPEGTVYIDLLVPAEKTSDKPIYNKLISLDGNEIILLEDSEIVNYNEDDFISFSVYLSDNISYGYLNNEPFYVDFGTDNDLDIKKEYEYFKVACLDKNGNVLKVSNMASAKSYGNILDFNYFSLSEKGIKPVYQLNPYNTVGIIVLIAILITIIIIVIQRKKEQKNKG